MPLACRIRRTARYAIRPLSNQSACRAGASIANAPACPIAAGAAATCRGVAVFGAGVLDGRYLRDLSHRLQCLAELLQLGWHERQGVCRAGQLYRAVPRADLLYRAQEQSVVAVAVSAGAALGAGGGALPEPGCRRHPPGQVAVLRAVCVARRGGRLDLQLVLRSHLRFA